MLEKIKERLFDELKEFENDDGYYFIPLNFPINVTEVRYDDIKYILEAEDKDSVSKIIREGYLEEFYLSDDFNFEFQQRILAQHLSQETLYLIQKYDFDMTDFICEYIYYDYDIDNLTLDVSQQVYKDWKIFSDNGVYRVGGKYNKSFNDCTLENLIPSIDEIEMVAWFKNRNKDIKFEDLRGDKGEVSFEVYHDNLRKPDELIVPVAEFKSVDEAIEFLDWIDSQIKYKNKDTVKTEPSVKKISSNEEFAQELFDYLVSKGEARARDVGMYHDILSDLNNLRGREWLEDLDRNLETKCFFDYLNVPEFEHDFFICPCAVSPDILSRVVFDHSCSEYISYNEFRDEWENIGLDEYWDFCIEDMDEAIENNEDTDNFLVGVSFYEDNEHFIRIFELPEKYSDKFFNLCDINGKLKTPSLGSAIINAENRTVKNQHTTNKEEMNHDK